MDLPPLPGVAVILVRPAASASLTRGPVTSRRPGWTAFTVRAIGMGVGAWAWVGPAPRAAAIRKTADIWSLCMFFPVGVLTESSAVILASNDEPDKTPGKLLDSRQRGVA